MGKHLVFFNPLQVIYSDRVSSCYHDVSTLKEVGWSFWIACLIVDLHMLYTQCIIIQITSMYS